MVFDGSDMLGADESTPYPASYGAAYPETKAGTVWFDIRAARRDFGYEPKVSIAEGLRRLSESIFTGAAADCETSTIGTSR